MNAYQVYAIPQTKPWAMEEYMGYEMASENWQRDGVLVRAHLEAAAPGVWHMKHAISEMKANDWPHWRQSEWPGFYFEYRESAIRNQEFQRGPRYGNVTFDLQSKLVWDLKVHVGDGGMVPLNDQEAVRDCIKEKGFLGWMVLTGSATYASDEDREWHTRFKGGLSAYSISNRAAGKPKRRIKGTFTPDKIIAFGIAGLDALDKALAEGWLAGFQEGMTNSNGKPRRAKFMANLDAIPEWALLRS
jgi:hypothetical protein